MSDAATLLPPNATPLQRALEQVEILRQALIAAANAGLWNAATCPLAVLPWLAWAFSVDVWDPAWPEPKKRDVVAASLGVHRRKGTRGALERALAAVGHPTRVVEWWEETPAPADPYTFRVEVGVDDGCTLPELRLIQAQILAAKNLRSWLTSLTLSAAPLATAYAGGAALGVLTVDLPARGA